jgi:putative oxidoreductase
MSALGLPQLRALRGYAPLVLRIAVGLVFMQHGWVKFQNVNGVATFFGSLHIPLPVLMAWVVTTVELLGGLCLILGLLTRLLASLQAFDMAVAILVARIPSGGFIPVQGKGGFELEMLLFAGALALAFLGAGRLSLDQRLGLNGDED